MGMHIVVVIIIFTVVVVMMVVMCGCLYGFAVNGIFLHSKLKGYLYHFEEIFQRLGGKGHQSIMDVPKAFFMMEVDRDSRKWFSYLS